MKVMQARLGIGYADQAGRGPAATRCTRDVSLPDRVTFHNRSPIGHHALFVAPAHHARPDGNGSDSQGRLAHPASRCRPYKLARDQTIGGDRRDLRGRNGTRPVSSRDSWRTRRVDGLDNRRAWTRPPYLTDDYSMDTTHQCQPADRHDSGIGGWTEANDMNKDTTNNPATSASVTRATRRRTALMLDGHVEIVQVQQDHEGNRPAAEEHLRAAT